MRLGSMLLESGTGSYRVKRAMHRAAVALGMDRHDASVSLTEIIATAHRGDNFRTVMREVYRVRVDAARISALHGGATRGRARPHLTYRQVIVETVAEHRGRWRCLRWIRHPQPVHPH